MSRLGKCHNYSGCLLAYRGEQAEVPDGQPFVCAECGKPLTEVKTSPMKLIAMIGTAVLVAAVVIGGFMLWSKMKKGEPPKPTVPPPTAAPATPTAPEATPVPNPDKKGDAEPPVEVVAPEKITLQVDDTLKREVLKRIDLMPNVTKANKDKLYNAVERAQQMGLVVTVPFDKGKTAITPKDAAALKAALAKPETVKLREQPTTVFVVLGFADPKGDPKANLGYSQSRADSVAAAIKRESGGLNIVHAVAMGASSLLDEQNLEKNRIAEVWVVVPR